MQDKEAFKIELSKIMKLFKKQRNKISMVTKFDEFFRDYLHYGIIQTRNKKTEDLLVSIILESEEILSSIHYLDWWRNIGISNKLPSICGNAVPKIFWNDLAKILLVYFHARMRAVLDYFSLFLLELIKMSKGIDQVNQKLTGNNRKKFTSFHKLFQWFTRVNTESEFSDIKDFVGQDIINLVKKGNWYDSVKFIRDSFFHSGIKILKSPVRFTWPMFFEVNSDGIYFGITTGLESFKNKLPKFLYEKGKLKNTINFELYAAYFLVKLYLLLESFAEISQVHLNLIKLGVKEPRESPNFQIILGWIEKLASRIKKE